VLEVARREDCFGQFVFAGGPEPRSHPSTSSWALEFAWYSTMPTQPAASAHSISVGKTQWSAVWAKTCARDRLRSLLLKLEVTDERHAVLDPEVPREALVGLPFGAVADDVGLPVAAAEFGQSQQQALEISPSSSRRA